MRMAGLLIAAALALPSLVGAGEAARSIDKGEAVVTCDPARTAPKKIAESVSKSGFEAKPKGEKER